VANQVLVDQLNVTMELKNSGVMLRVNTNGRLKGYLQISKGKLRWFRGREQSPVGEFTLDEFIRMAEGQNR